MSLDTHSNNSAALNFCSDGTVIKFVEMSYMTGSTNHLIRLLLANKLLRYGKPKIRSKYGYNIFLSLCVRVREREGELVNESTSVTEETQYSLYGFVKLPFSINTSLWATKRFYETTTTTTMFATHFVLVRLTSGEKMSVMGKSTTPASSCLSTQCNCSYPSSP